jgi:hypothetical protein
VTDILSQPEMLGVVIHIGRSRAIAAGVDPSHYDSICASLQSAADWTPAFVQTGETHEALARQAASRGLLITAEDAHQAAAAAYHISTTVPFSDRSGHLKAGTSMDAALRIAHKDAVWLEAVPARARVRCLPNCCNLPMATRMPPRHRFELPQ